MPPEAWIKIAAIVLFLVAPFVVFHRLNVDYQAAQTELESYQGLTMNLMNMMIGTLSHTGEAAVTLEIELTNRGKPTVADRWNLTIQQGARSFETRQAPLRFIRDAHFDDAQGRKIEFDESAWDLLETYRKTPLEQGRRVRGIITFIVRNVAPEQIREPDTILTVECSDSYGHRYTKEHRYGDGV